MQTLVQVVCKPGRQTSLREAIVKSRGLDEYELRVTLQKRPGRAHGWAKVQSDAPGRRGALNLEWDQANRILNCRVVTRRGKPHRVIGDFVAFLLKNFGRRIASVHVIPR